MTAKELIARKPALRFLSEREQRLFFCDCYRAIMLWREKRWRYLPEIELAERYARGEATDAEIDELCREVGENYRSIVTGDAYALAEYAVETLERIEYRPPMKRRQAVYEGD